MGNFITLQDKVEKTLRSGVFDDKRPEGLLTRIRLCEHIKGADPVLVQDWPVQNPAEISIDQLKEEIISFAQESAESAGEKKSFIIVLHFGVAEAAVHHSLPFTVTPSAGSRALAKREVIGELFEDEDDQRFMTTTGGYRQMLAIAIKDKQDTQRLFTGALETIFEHQREIVGELTKENRHLREKHFEVLEVYEDLVTQKHTRSLEEKREAAKQARQDEAWSLFRPLVPTLVNKIAGRKILPDKVIPVLETMRELMGSISADQMKMLASASGLKPPQVVAVFEVWETFRQEYDEKQKADAEAAKAKENGASTSQEAAKN